MIRRNFMKLSAAGIAGMVAVTTGCPFSTVYSNIQSYVPMGLATVSAILGILADAGISLGPAATIVSLIVQAFGIVSAAITDYLNAPSTTKATLLGKISNALIEVENSINDFWAAVNIPNPQIANLIQNLLATIVQAIGGFLSQLPAPAQAVRTGPKPILAPAVKMSPAQFRKQVNDLLNAAGKGQFAIQ